jgi:hypothetical protein
LKLLSEWNSPSGKFCSLSLLLNLIFLEMGISTFILSAWAAVAAAQTSVTSEGAASSTPSVIYSPGKPPAVPLAVRSP